MKVNRPISPILTLKLVAMVTSLERSGKGQILNLQSKERTLVHVTTAVCTVVLTGRRLDYERSSYVEGNTFDSGIKTFFCNGSVPVSDGIKV